MIKHTLISILFCSITYLGYAQKATINFDKAITELNSIGKQIIGEISDEDKYQANENFKLSLKEVIKNPSSFDYEFDSLKTISILKANKLKIYNWALPLTDGTFEYFAFLQIKKSNDEYNIVELTDQSEKINHPETKLLTPKMWYGALYYKIIYDKKLVENYYTLLGWDGNNNLTNKKIIEVINISENGMIKLGASLFKTEKKTKKRIIFEYSESVVMSLKYHPKEKTIVFDELIPASSKLKGIYEYYGPALNRFDAFSIGKGKWIYEEDIDIELDRSIKDFMWKDPKKK